MPTLLGKRDYSEHDVIAEFAYSGSYPVSKGTFVKVTGSGYVPSADIVGLGGPVGASYGGTLSERWVSQSVVAPVTNTGETILGMLLYDGKELDENGLRLVWDKRKRDEMNVFISGENAPVVVAGQFRYSGIIGNPVPGDALYFTPEGGGQLSVTGAAGKAIAKALSVKDTRGVAYIRLNILN